jgi:hypothetical protein
MKRSVNSLVDVDLDSLNHLSQRDSVTFTFHFNLSSTNTPSLEMLTLEDVI